MAYASKYYDPVKAHAYYMRNRELKGYEDRYGGARGNGTSAASSNSFSGELGYRTKSGGNSVTGSLGYSNKSGSNSISGNISRSSNTGNTSKQLTSTQRHNQGIKNQIQNLRDQLKNMSSEDRKANRESINDRIQALRQQLKGGSTSGFNQKGVEAAAYIKDQMEKERDDIIKKTNKDADKEMLSKVKSLSADIQAMRKSGHGFSHNEFKARIKSLLGETKKAKLKAKRKHIANYKQKYKDEIDKLRGDNSMFSYYDNKETRRNSLDGSLS